ncbi:hypothetical protein ACTFIW_012632 [Dictyostelium discoideum]
MITNVNSPQPPSQFIDDGYLVLSEINICDDSSKNQEIENEFKNIKEILDKLTKAQLKIHVDLKVFENNFNSRLDTLENNFIYFKKAIVNEKIIISKVSKSELMLLGLDNNFNIKKIYQPSISQQQPLELKSFNVFEWKETEKYYESTMDINNYFHYIIDQGTEDMENMYLSNISNQHTALKCQVGDVELSGSGDYLLVINEKGNPEKRCKLDLDYVKNPSNIEFNHVYLGFEVKSTSTINEFQGIAELIAITRMKKL